MIISTLSNRPDVLACSSAAERAGVSAGMSVAAALALYPGLQVIPRDEKAEWHALTGVAVWAGQFSPTISIAHPYGLLLEVSSTLTYFGGLRNLIKKMEDGLCASGWDPVLASAPTSSGARLLARAGLEVHTRDREKLKKHLNALPLGFLDGARDALDVLHGLGVHCIEDLLNLPSEGVARRFGQNLLDEIRRAQGDLPDTVPVFVPPERYLNRIELPSPVIDAAALLFALKRLVTELSGFLCVRGMGVTRLAVELVHENTPPTRLDFGLAITRNAEHILRIMRERLAREVLPEHVEAILLESSEISPFAATNRDFFPGAQNVSEDHTQLLERLYARLGEDAVRGIRPREDHRPELAWSYSNVPVDAVHNQAANDQIEKTESDAQPLWLLSQPRRLANDGTGLALIAGPQRIESGWWQGDDVARDYFVAHNQRGEKCWVFRDRQGQWFTHGLFA